MKVVSLPEHDDKLRAILIEGANYEGNVIYVPCQLSNGKEISLGVLARENEGIFVRRQPVLLLGAATGPELAVATMHTRRIHTTQNINAELPLLFVDERAEIDLTVYNQPQDQPITRHGRIAYEYRNQQVQGKYARGPARREIYISDQLISHSELEKLTQKELNEAVERTSSVDSSWSKLCDDHRTGRLTINLPGIELYLRFEREHGIYLPKFYADSLKHTAGTSTISPPSERSLERQRHALVEFIEMLSGMRSLLVNDVSIAYDGTVPVVEFSRNDQKLSLLVNELPLFGNFLVADNTQPSFEKKFAIYENLTQAITAITTRMNYA